MIEKISIKNTFKDAWECISGFKKTALMSFAIILFIPMASIFIPALMVGFMDKFAITTLHAHPYWVSSFIVVSNIVAILLLVPGFAALSVQGVDNVTHGSVRAKSVLPHYRRFFPLVTAAILFFVLILTLLYCAFYVLVHWLAGAALGFMIARGVGALLTLLALYYISLRYKFFLTLMVKKNYGIFKSFAASWRATRGNGGRLLLIYLGIVAANGLVFALLTAVSKINAWGGLAASVIVLLSTALYLPLVLNIYGVLYQKLVPSDVAISQKLP